MLRDVADAADQRTLRPALSARMKHLRALIEIKIEGTVIRSEC